MASKYDKLVVRRNNDLSNGLKSHPENYAYVLVVEESGVRVIVGSKLSNKKDTGLNAKVNLGVASKHQDGEATMYRGRQEWSGKGGWRKTRDKMSKDDDEDKFPK